MNAISTGFVLLILLFQSSAHAGGERATCGISGTVESRIRDCENLNLSAARGVDFFQVPQYWKLITRLPNPKFKKTYAEVWLDTGTNLVWGDAVLTPMARKNWVAQYTSKKAKEYCRNSALVENGKLTDLKFRVPTAEDYDLEIPRQIVDVLPNFLRAFPNFSESRNYRYQPAGFWTSSKVNNDPKDPIMKMFDSTSNSTRTMQGFKDEKIGTVVRCVSEYQFSPD